MLSVVVPTFNEGKNIRNLVTQIDDALKGIPYEIVFVDDSKDDTPQVIMEVAKDFPAVRMEHRTGETGLATAVLKGTGTESLYLVQPVKSVSLCYRACERFQTRQAVCSCSAARLLKMPTYSRLDGRLWSKFLQWVHTRRL